MKKESHPIFQAQRSIFFIKKENALANEKYGQVH